uniref:NIF system FeS cluster assembly NifU C-terminal domain-containing protein n=1 Tax=Octactis speculum TaxID=3111310 RepID=A0A7S2DPW5_9STRA|mmetsp:Transcript_51547/g.70228  ORF Transcript_51547/g.70228 Transcript_51547/m.70228 type:complete len:237 (+) Transcript_51547:60-770(+)
MRAINGVLFFLIRLAQSWHLPLRVPSPTCFGWHNQVSSRRNMALFSDTVASPFREDDYDLDDDDDDDDDAQYIPEEGENLVLTLENVELVLDRMRPYLISDGGNVVVKEIDGPVVILELQGACGSCPSSTVTMKMGLERGLKEAIPEIQEVIQALPDMPELNETEVETVLDGIRPFLQVAGGEISISEISGLNSVQPLLVLKMTGASSSIQSVKLEIMQRLQRHFMLSGLRIDWEK